MVPRRPLEVVPEWVQPQPGRAPVVGGHSEPAPSRKGDTTKRAAGAPSLVILEEQREDQLLPTADLAFAFISCSKPRSSQEKGCPWMQPVLTTEQRNIWEHH